MSELMLPVAKNPLAQIVHERVKDLQMHTAPGVPTEPFVAALVLEANLLVLNVKSEEMSKPRTKASFAKAMLNAAFVGLMPGGALGHCYFIPYKNRKGNYTEITYVPGYRGFLELAFANTP